MTGGERVFSSIFVEGMSAAGLWLVFNLILLAGLVLKTNLTLFCPAGLICEAAPLIDLALETCLT